MIIITKNNKYYWNYKHFFRNLLIVGAVAFFLIAYAVTSTMDYNTMIGK